MISAGFKKLAVQNDMEVAKGVAFGNYKGYAVTFYDGSNIKVVEFSTMILDPVRKTMFLDTVNTAAVKKEYRIQNLAITDKRIQVVFSDTIGTLKKIQAFLDWFIPVLRQFGATGLNVCTNCGGELTNGRWVLIDGAACYLHDICCRSLEGQISASNDRRREEDSGNYISGAFGAFGGAILGAVAWAVVLMMGYVASIVGFLIGFLSQKGYDLMKGKQGKGKVFILILSVIFGVCAGTVGGYIAQGLKELGDMFTIPEYFELSLEIISENPSDLLIGLLFAALGVFGLLYAQGKAVADDRLTYLK